MKIALCVSYERALLEGVILALWFFDRAYVQDTS